MRSENFINTDKIFTAEVIVASGNALSRVIDLQHCDGSFSLQLLITGDGTLRLDALQLSNDGVNFLAAEGALAIKAGLLETSGPGGDGKVLIFFSSGVARYAKISLTETGGANSVTVTGFIAIQ